MSKKIRKDAGLPPGSLVFTGNQKMDNVHIHHVLFNEARIQEEEWQHNKIFKIQRADENLIEWFDVRGLHDTALIEMIGEAFEIHPLVLEDMVDVRQRPKFEEYETGDFILLKALHFNEESEQIESEQVSIYFNKQRIISFQENEDDLFAAIRKRLKAAKGKIRKRGTDYFAYALLDSLIDNYYIVLDKIEHRIEQLELEIQEDPRTSAKAKLYDLKQQLLFMRRAISPLREAIARFSRSDSDFLSESSVIFIRDLYDHIIQITDAVETYRDMLNGLHDLYLTEISFQQNKVMQLLTLITTIFVPLSFLAGLYGMNFENMPELHFKYGYFVLLTVMALVVVACIIYFKRQRWL